MMDDIEKAMMELAYQQGYMDGVMHGLNIAFESTLEKSMIYSSCERDIGLGVAKRAEALVKAWREE